VVLIPISTHPTAQPCGEGGCNLYGPKDLLNKNVELHLIYLQKLIENGIYSGHPLNKKVC
jgi:hypothetical protein